ncbi:MAG TPA: menaquinone biosynthesis protein, partial [Pyrinomonadaceae bacterium]|nr:menaquinone biosynthesis protein [Pyrinomonadaceae bacterium]
MKGREGEAPRVAASRYLNSAPLIWSFMRGRLRASVELLTDTAPARCAEMLARAEVEAALVPVIEYQRIPEIVVVPDVCVGARSRVRSVVLVTRRGELKEVRSVALDTSSRTSAALVRIIFREFLGRSPEFKPSAPDLDLMLEESDAALVIGDPAMVFPRDNLRVYDLASLWREHTGLGFVFAMWMARADATAWVGKIDFAGARDEGLERVDEIVAHYEAMLGLKPFELRS